MRALNGPFFSQAQGIHVGNGGMANWGEWIFYNTNSFAQVGWKSMDMYLAEKMTIEQIADYFYYNYNSLSLSPEQYQIVSAS
jgi:hypothetical protein